MFCLSKGLCAPVGSMLVGTREHMERARIFRKALGGGMRQVGVLAAAGLIALNSMTERLAEDHANARMMAESLAEMPGVEIDLNGVQTNIVRFRLTDGKSAIEVVAGLKRRGVMAGNLGPHAIRLVTHNDVSRAQCQDATARIREALTGV